MKIRTLWVILGCLTTSAVVGLTFAALVKAIVPKIPETLMLPLLVAFGIGLVCCLAAAFALTYLFESLRSD